MNKKVAYYLYKNINGRGLKLMQLNAQVFGGMSEMYKEKKKIDNGMFQIEK